MNIYKIYQTINRNYDSYDSAIVVANTEEEAKQIHPSGYNNEWEVNYLYKSWVDNPEDVDVEYIGIAHEKYTENQVILASYNAG